MVERENPLIKEPFSRPWTRGGVLPLPVGVSGAKEQKEAG